MHLVKLNVISCCPGTSDKTIIIRNLKEFLDLLKIIPEDKYELREIELVETSTYLTVGEFLEENNEKEEKQ